MVWHSTITIPAEHLEELSGLVMEHMVRMCRHVGDEEVERAKTQVMGVKIWMAWNFVCMLTVNVENSSMLTYY